MSNFESNIGNMNKLNENDYFPISFEELEEKARNTLSDPAFRYISTGAGRESSMKKNVSVFDQYELVPKLLRNVSNLDMSVNLFDKNYPTPFLLAPTGVLKMTDSEGDVAAVKGAGTHGIPLIQSTISSCSIEEVAEAAGSNPKWFQLYWSEDESISYSMVNRVEKAGYEAIVLTIDTITLGWRESDLRLGFSPIENGFGQGNYESDPVFMNGIQPGDQQAIFHRIVENLSTPGLDWTHIAALKKHTSLPVLLKGVLHPDDAKTALNHGIDGIIVSNHGGRQLDGTITSLDALPAITEVVGGKIPVVFDSGIRRGTDAIKAIALGADAVLIGRPFVYSLAAAGEQGVRKFLDNFLEDFRSSMMLAGVRSIEDIQQMKIVKKGF